VIDRRAEPMHGYRAVHVIVFPDGAPIEIQVRTAWQHE
jgi:ppGpp synthetase/RelA/SpoT-type nucleotidyltranferase